MGTAHQGRRTFVAAALASVTTAGCAAPRRKPTIRFQVTATLNYGAESRRATTIFESTYYPPPSGPFASLYNGPTGETKAEALVFDLGARGVLVGVLGHLPGVSDEQHHWFGYDPLYLPIQMATDELLVSSQSEYRQETRDGAELARAIVTPYAIRIEHWPGFVHFADRANLQSARWVQVPGQQIEGHELRFESDRVARTSLAEVCGDRDARIDSIIMQQTDAPYSNAVMKQLPFLETVQGGPNAPEIRSAHNASLADNLEFSHFRSWRDPAR